MKENFWNTYPVIAAMTLGAAGAALLLNGFYLLQGVAETSDELFKYQLRIGAALALWVAGCGMTSRTRHGSWTRGLLCGLLFIPGLVILLLTTGRKTRQEIWEEANPGLVGRAHRRQYRDVKPLY
ncbi:MAG: hypothetical protein JWM59_2556 [Verrucomicrobiales bacterium]|nr:hypothetical protein [Verrucomicrobiales bacterium]